MYIAGQWHNVVELLQILFRLAMAQCSSQAEHWLLLT